MGWESSLFLQRQESRGTSGRQIPGQAGDTGPALLLSLSPLSREVWEADVPGPFCAEEPPQRRDSS